MKISEFRKLNNALCRVIHTIKLCMGKVEVDEALVSYDGHDFTIDLTCEFTGFDLGYLSSSIDGDSAELMIRAFVRSLIIELKGMLKVAERQQKEQNFSSSESEENPITAEINSIKMLIDVLTGFLPEK